MIACVVGGGAREHAIANALARTVDVVVTPGNPGIDGRSPEGHQLTSSAAPAEEITADLFVIGPEGPLVDGLADRLRSKGAKVFGPGAAGAQLEGSKAFMKEVAAAAGVPTAAFGAFTDADEAGRFLETLSGGYVVKTDGLAAGKGVLVTDDLAEARADIRDKLSGASFGDAGRRVVIEEAMRGPELSLLVLTDGMRSVALPAAQDHKRIGDGDTGPNTGGMGAYSPVPLAPQVVCDQVMETLIEPTLAELRRRGIEYRGVLYAGCMLTETGPKLVEFNVRFGDPETEVVLPRLSGDLAGLLAEVAEGRLKSVPTVTSDAALCVVLASAGYPVSSRSGDPITGVERAGTVRGVSVLHGGTALNGGVLSTAGGRVLTVTALAADLAAARDRAYEAVAAIDFPGMQFRRDIGAQALRSAS